MGTPSARRGEVFAWERCLEFRDPEAPMPIALGTIYRKVCMFLRRGHGAEAYVPEPMLLFSPAPLSTFRALTRPVCASSLVSRSRRRRS